MRQRQRQQTLVAGLRGAWLARWVAGLAALSVGGAAAQPPATPSDAEVCRAANQSLSLGAALPRTTARLSAAATLRIVAIGSSSTTGLWVASRAATYPEVMRRELARLLPNEQVADVIRGHLDGTIGGRITRLEA